MSENRSCENCGNAACANSFIAFNYDDCVESKYTRHWKPKEIDFSSMTVTQIKVWLKEHGVIRYLSHGYWKKEDYISLASRIQDEELLSEVSK